MKIGLIDVDGHRFPNIPLMKISAYHKARGDTVSWYDPKTTGHCDVVYMSKVFSFTPDYSQYIDADRIIRGGERVLYRIGKRKRSLSCGARSVSSG